MATISRASSPQQLIPGLNAVFGMAYGEIDNEHEVLFTTEMSERSFEEEVLQTGFGEAPIKVEGAPIAYDDAQESYTARYVHLTVALGFNITEEAMEDNLYDTYSKIAAKGLGRSMASTKQVRAANVFNTGFSQNQGDGVPLFSAAHPTVTGNTQSNIGTTDLSETALENALIDISLYQDPRGILINSMGMSVHIPPQLQFVIDKILTSAGSTRVFQNTALNAATNINDINSVGKRGLDWYINHRFTDPDAWFIRTDVPNSTKHFIRTPLATKMDGDFDTGNMRYKARERYSFGVSDWRGWWGSAGA